MQGSRHSRTKLPDISDEAPKDYGTDPWDNEPWRDSKPDGDSEVGIVGDDDNDNDKKGFGNLMDSHEKREFEQLKACVLQSLYGNSECTGASPERFTTMADSTAKPTQEDDVHFSDGLNFQKESFYTAKLQQPRRLCTKVPGREMRQEQREILYVHKHISRTSRLHRGRSYGDR